MENVASMPVLMREPRVVVANHGRRSSFVPLETLPLLRFVPSVSFPEIESWLLQAQSGKQEGTTHLDPEIVFLAQSRLLVDSFLFLSLRILHQAATMNHVASQ